MISKYSGKCGTCSKPYKAGDEIHWSREDGAHHPECWKQKTASLFGSDAEQIALADRLGFIQFRPSDGPEGLLRRMSPTDSGDAGRTERVSHRRSDATLLEA